MKNNFLNRVITLSSILLKEHIKEPTAFLWTLLSPCAIFYFITFSRGESIEPLNSYTASTSWFYAYIASNVALFGFSFYIIGRRESGFVRSFIFNKSARTIFLFSHFLGYSIISLLYCSIFYLATKPVHGNYSIYEAAHLLAGFYVCFLLFCIPGLLLALAPLKFQTASTLFSIISFTMLTFAFFGNSDSNALGHLNVYNPLELAKKIITASLKDLSLAAMTIFTAFLFTALAFVKHFRINPVWSRY